MGSEAVMRREQRYLTALGRARRFEPSGRVLLIFGEEPEQLLRLTPTQQAKD